MTLPRVFKKPITRPRLHDEIVNVLQEQILDRTLEPGAKLPPERTLSESLGVNRATVREAMRKLEHMELVEIRQGDGVYVKDFFKSGNLDLIKAAVAQDQQGETIFNVLEVRRIVVPEMAALAAQRRTESDLVNLEQVVNQSDLNILERDLQVHQQIALASKNFFYTIMLNFFNQLFQENAYIYFDDDHNAQVSARFHQDILQAIKEQNVQEARRVMMDVLEYAEEVVREQISNSST